MKPATRIILLALLVLIGAYSMGARVSWAYNFTVNNPADEVDANPGDTFCETPTGNGICTLRAAIQEANSFPEQHNIALPAGTYSLSLGELTIAKNITINGAGKGITIINGDALSRVFNSQVGGTLTLNNLTVRNGAHTGGGTNSGGGGIYNQGELILQNVSLSNNHAGNGGGIFNDGILTINNSAISNNQAGNGGGIFNDGFATIVDVTLDFNSAGSGPEFGGGGIYNSGTLILNKTTITGSEAGTGGGLFNSGIIDLTNVTLSGNKANSSGGGLYNGKGGGAPEATLSNVTISNNTAPNGGGSAIFNIFGNSIDLKNTIVSSSVGGNCAGTITSSTITSNGHNLDSGNTCGLTAPPDYINTPPQLNSLQYNGGPTLTHALLPGSPAIDHGYKLDCPATDQRGYPRPSACDIGAYEVNSNNLAPAITTLIPHTALTALPSDPPLTLTVNGYNFVAGSKVLWIGVERTTIFLNASQLTATIPATDLAAPGTAQVTVSNLSSGGGISDPPATFTIATPNPIPAITTLTPDMRRVGGSDFTLTVNGSHFLGESLSVVLWNGFARPTTFKGSSQLTAEITAADDLAAEGTASVTVSNSPPGGGVSAPATFTIGPPLYLFLPLIIRN
jgi:CSLREA domain-containing protein